jgi:hypothetical protein
MIPTIRKSAPVVIPWLSIWSIAPMNPKTVKVKIPRVTNPMWATLE